MNPKDKASPVKKTGLASRLFSSAQSTEKSLIPDGKQTLDDSLNKLYKLTKKNFDEEKKTSETFRSFEKVKEREKTKRHNEFVKVLSGVLKQNKATAKAAAEEIARLQQELSKSQQGGAGGLPQIPRIPGKGGAPKPGAPKPQAPKPEAPAPKPQAPKPEAPAPKPQPPKPEAPKPEAPKPQAPKPEAPKPEAPKPQAPKPEAPKPQAPKPEAPKPEAPAPKPQTQTPAQTQPVPKQSTVKPESLPSAPKPQAPKPEAPKPQAPKPEAPKPEAPKPQAPRPEAPKPEAPKPQTQPQTQPATQPSVTTQPVPKQSTVKPESLPSAPKPSATPAPKPSAPSTAGQTASKVATGAAVATTAALAGKEALAANIAKYESTGSSGKSFGGNEYNAYNKGTSGNKMIPADTPIDFSKMTIAEYLRRGSLKSGDPDKLFAVGRYQIIPETMKGLVKNLKIDPNTTYLDPATQDLLFAKGLTTSVKGRTAVDDYINGKPGVTRDAAILALAQEFASVGVPYDTKRGNVEIKKGQSYYSGVGGNKAHNSPEEVGAALDADRAKKLNGTSNPQQLPPTTGVQINEASTENKNLKNATPQTPAVVNQQTTVIQKGGNNTTNVHKKQNDKPLHQR